MDFGSVLDKDPTERYKDIVGRFKKDWILHNIVEKAIFLTGALAIMYAIYYLVRYVLLK